MSARRSTVVTAVSVLVAFAGSSTPAQADPHVVLASSPPGVIFEECSEHPISYSVDPPADANFWSIHFTVQAPDGTTADDFISVSSTRNAPTGVVTVQLCGSESGAGTFTVTGDYEYYQGRITPTETIAVTPFTFDMRLPATHVAATPSDRTPRRGRAVTVTVKVTEEQPTGELRGAESAKVLLQRVERGRWVKVRGAKGVTSGNGVAKLRFKQAWRGRTRFRAFANLGFAGRSASPSFVLRTRR